MKRKPHIYARRVAALSVTCLAMWLLIRCEVEDPVREDTPELITSATLTFTPDSGAPVVVTAADPDGEGVKDIATDKPIELQAGKTYSLTIELINELADPKSPDYDISAEVAEQGSEHMFFFGWTGDVFRDPSGNGNVDDRVGQVNYEDRDEASLPIGLQTSWTTGDISSGTFHVVLKHQPGLKSETSTASQGETDLDITFSIIVR